MALQATFTLQISCIPAALSLLTQISCAGGL